ncbi:nickel ABC transporter ATP-binding protein NikE [Ketogulonicigenium vulgare]|uniref:ABC-type dipeptide transport system, ATPase component n=1 Tax=Ketogulonicigenium vulgare (strain WSH-001) TaxID=759362 RepID=F9Y8R9_KETVW|nr:ABC transporter ATP-binding protein [Ketogulonicigenium vulgare]ADO43062.1 putative oligopeptide ABC transporter, ATP-binding protein [Ketogulonicigenium vulgare Y25]AEM41238.1 ABC-type dipeptide transport system, ATPase component [Ketogulonicigenium vulgare WSH-001]ALJ81380.1 glutathione ABC transporter ATP-binding protein [Ketogulonicigenium vulgare]ANW34108.1 glutathione ABC transporter ATP-binding protein [Ketogulonicigenium vulgare]AOZ54974.1 oligopeptide ABC transporter ATP-binding pr
MADILQITDLCVDFGAARAVDGLSLALARGQVTALVGESGSGKSMTAMAVLGLLPANAQVTGTVAFEGAVIPAAAGLGQWRGRGISTVFQDPSAALDPVFSIGFQIAEVLRLRHPDQNARARKKAVIALLAEVGIPDPARRMHDFAHQFSGGQQQRIMIAMALAGRPQLLIADEPTTALDVTVQRDILELLQRLVRDRDMTLLLITHDMGVVAEMADRILVMKDGRLVEAGEAPAALRAPQSAYTRHLLNAATAHRPSPAPVQALVVLAVRDLVLGYQRPFRAPHRIVRGVSFTIHRGETLGLIGESGSGKSTTGRSLVGLAKVIAGAIEFEGMDLSALRGPSLRAARARIGFVFQSPSGALNPKLTIAQIIAEPLRAHLSLDRAEIDTRVAALIAQVELPASFATRHPHQLSGGQKQRVAIARALALSPSLLIADEPTSALDVSIRGEILDLLQRIQQETGLACLFISHDLEVVRGMCHRVAIMQDGAIVEANTNAAIFAAPQDPYTRRLLASRYGQ